MGSKRRAQPSRLAAKLLQIRMSLDLTQGQMAERIDVISSPVHRGHVSEYEQGKREPSLLVLLQYARVAGISTDVLIDDERDLPARVLRKATTQKN